MIIIANELPDAVLLSLIIILLGPLIERLRWKCLSVPIDTNYHLLKRGK